MLDPELVRKYKWWYGKYRVSLLDIKTAVFKPDRLASRYRARGRQATAEKRMALLEQQSQAQGNQPNELHDYVVSLWPFA